VKKQRVMERDRGLSRNRRAAAVVTGPERRQHPLGRASALGNAAIQRMLGSTVRRQTATQNAASVPGLPGDVVTEVQSKLEADRTTALASLQQALSSSGEIDLSFLDGGAMTYVSDTSRMRPGHSGLTSLSPGSGRPRPCRVEIGPDAFRSVSALFTTVMHEWQHVLQFRRPESNGEASDELEARLWEIENLEQTGLWLDASYMGRIRGQLDHWWGEMSAEKQSPYRPRYETALETIAKMRERLADEQFRQQQGGG